MGDSPTIYACLAVSGSFQPQDLSTMLDAAARITRTGEARRDGTPWESDSWHFSTARTASVDWPEHLDRVLDLVRPRMDEFRSFCRDRDLDVEIHLVAEMSKQAPIGSFTA
ncbi:MAG TPA: DUF4279 domain-containing protein, partial [Mycobacterium sp.]|nr:DUF4279 domain-containing protein [Mycobacterium sp.]